MERSVHDALCVVKRVLESNQVVPGGGAVEAALSIYLETFATSIVSEVNGSKWIQFIFLTCNNFFISCPILHQIPMMHNTIDLKLNQVQFSSSTVFFNNSMRPTYTDI